MLFLGREKQRHLFKCIKGYRPKEQFWETENIAKRVPGRGFS